MDREVLHIMGVDRWGTRGTRPLTFQPEWDNIGNVLILFQFIKNVQAYRETDYSPFLKSYIGLVEKLI